MKKTDLKKHTQERIFILTDACLWEMNKKQGAYHPHAIEVVDIETGQVRFIESGSRIKFVEGSISDSRDQDSYNKLWNSGSISQKL